MLFDRDRFNLYPWYLSDECLTFDIEKIFGKKLDMTLLEFKNNFLYYHGDVEKFNKMGEFLFEKVKNDRDFYGLVEKNILSTGNDLMNFCDSLKKKDITKLSNEELNNLYRTYGKKLKTMRAWGWVPPLIDGVEVYFLSDYLQKNFKKYMKKIGQEEKAPKYYSLLSSAEKMSEVQIEEIERLKILKRIEESNLVKSLKERKPKKFLFETKDKNKKIAKLIKKHANKFAWLPYGYIGPVMNEKDVIKYLKDNAEKKESAKEQMQEIEDHYKKLPKMKKKIVNKINLPDNLKYLFNMSAFFMHLKDQRKGVYQKSYVAMDSVIKEIAKRLNLTVEETKYLTSKEIKKALLENYDYKKMAKQRTKYCVAIVKNGNTKAYQGKKAKDVKKEFAVEEKSLGEIDELKGMVAYAGKARGLAKKILVVKDMKKMKEGDVLISSATNPDLVPAMKQASAFVTDTGGITSHAAIVAREMKKPCVIGTKVATKAIKDGDEIEVDAEKGIVRIIK